MRLSCSGGLSRCRWSRNGCLLRSGSGAFMMNGRSCLRFRLFGQVLRRLKGIDLRLVWILLDNIASLAGAIFKDCNIL